MGFSAKIGKFEGQDLRELYWKLVAVVAKENKKR